MLGLVMDDYQGERVSAMWQVPTLIPPTIDILFHIDPSSVNSGFSFYAVAEKSYDGGVTWAPLDGVGHGLGPLVDDVELSGWTQDLTGLAGKHVRVRLNSENVIRMSQTFGEE